MPEPKIRKERKHRKFSEEEITLIKELYNAVDSQGNPLTFLEITKRFKAAEFTTSALNDAVLVHLVEKLIKSGDLVKVDRTKNRHKGKRNL